MSDSEWPKITIAYLHSNKEDMYDLGVELGLSEEALDEFKYALCEVRLHIAVKEDGSHVTFGWGE